VNRLNEFPRMRFAVAQTMQGNMKTTHEIWRGSLMPHRSWRDAGSRKSFCPLPERSARCFAGAIAAFFLFGFSAQAGVTIVDLGYLSIGPPGTQRVPMAMNNSGQVIGVDITGWNGSYQSFQSWFWQNGALTDLGTEQRKGYLVKALNNSGQVVGTLDGAAFLWQNGVMTDLGTFAGTFSQAIRINDAGQVIGAFYDGSFWKAFIWQNGMMTPLGTLGGRTSTPYGINKYGQIAGNSEMSDGRTIHAFLWQNGVKTDLGALSNGGNSLVNDSASCINDSGQVIGQAGPSYPYSRAFLWANGVMKDLGTLGG